MFYLLNHTAVYILLRWAIPLFHDQNKWDRMSLQKIGLYLPTKLHTVTPPRTRHWQRSYVQFPRYQIYATQNKRSKLTGLLWGGGANAASTRTTMFPYKQIVSCFHLPLYNGSNSTQRIAWVLNLLNMQYRVPNASLYWSMEHFQLDTSFFTSDIRIKYLYSSSYINIAFIIYSFQSISILDIYVTTHPKQMKELSENRIRHLRSALLPR